MFEGKTKAVLQLLTKSSKGGVLHPKDNIPTNNGKTQSVLEALKSKHPQIQPASAAAVQSEDEEPTDVHPVIFDRINATTIRTAALHTTGAGCRIDAKGWRRLCTAFGSASNDLCHSPGRTSEHNICRPHRTFPLPGMQINRT